MSQNMAKTTSQFNATSNFKQELDYIFTPAPFCLAYRYAAEITSSSYYLFKTPAITPLPFNTFISFESKQRLSFES